MTKYEYDQLTIIRRAAERGRAFGHDTKNSPLVDTCQHILDELYRIINGDNNENGDNGLTKP